MKLPRSTAKLTLPSSIDPAYDDNYLYEDAAWLKLAGHPWVVTPQLLFSMKQYIVDRAQRKGFIYDEPPEDAKGIDLGY